jgi:dienelactone hydrolase
MANILLFHHAQGLTPGLRSFADAVRDAGHVVHTPDLYDGKTFPTVTEGVQHARSLGFTNILERGVGVAEGLPSDLVYGGFSLGVMPAQRLAQTRPGARGALLFSATLPLSEFGGSWPAGVPLQMHMMEQDEWVLEGDLDAAREIASSVRGAELYLYPGNRHLFMDSSLSDFDKDAASRAMERVLRFLEKVDIPSGSTK